MACLFALLSAPALAQKYKTIPYKEAVDHVDALVWVKGTVLRAQASGEGTYLYFHNDRKYVTLFVPKEYLKNFQGGLSHLYVNKRVEAFGKVQQMGSRLILAVDGPKKIKVVEESAT